MSSTLDSLITVSFLTSPTTDFLLIIVLIHHQRMLLTPQFYSFTISDVLILEDSVHHRPSGHAGLQAPSTSSSRPASTSVTTYASSVACTGALRQAPPSTTQPIRLAPTPAVTPAIPKPSVSSKCPTPTAQHRQVLRPKKSVAPTPTPDQWQVVGSKKSAAKRKAADRQSTIAATAVPQAQQATDTAPPAKKQEGENL